MGVALLHGKISLTVLEMVTKHYWLNQGQEEGGQRRGRFGQEDLLYV